MANPPTPLGDAVMDVGTEYAFSCKVTISENEADIEIRRDGQMLFQWSGDASQVNRNHVLRPEAVELETAYYTISRLTGLRLRML